MHMHHACLISQSDSKIPFIFPSPHRASEILCLQIHRDIVIDSLKKVEPYSLLFNICLSFNYERYIEAVRKLWSQGVTLHRTVHMTFVPGNF